MTTNFAYHYVAIQLAGGGFKLAGRDSKQGGQAGSRDPGNVVLGKQEADAKFAGLIAVCFVGLPARVRCDGTPPPPPPSQLDDSSPRLRHVPHASAHPPLSVAEARGEHGPLALGHQPLRGTLLGSCSDSVAKRIGLVPGFRRSV